MTAIYARIMRCNFLKLDTSFFRFVFQKSEKLTPTGIGNRFGKTMVSDHALYVQVFHGYKAVGVHNITGSFVEKIRPLVSNLAVKFRYGAATFLSICRSFFRLGKPSLFSHKLLFRLTEIFRAVYNFTVRENSKRFYPEVDADKLPGYGLPDRLAFDRKTSKPPIGFPLNSTRLYDTIHGAVQFDFYRAYLGEPKSLFRYLKGWCLRVSDRIVSPHTLKAGIAGFFTRLHPAEEILKCTFYPKKDRLQDLGVDTGKKLYSFLV